MSKIKVQLIGAVTSQSKPRGMLCVEKMEENIMRFGYSHKICSIFCSVE